MVASSDPAWIQGVFTALVGLFDRVVLQTNVRKTVSMVCHPCQAGAVNNSRRLLTNYWRHLTMVARAGGYYGPAF